MNITTENASFLGYVTQIDFSHIEVHILEELKRKSGGLAYNELLIVELIGDTEYLLVRVRDNINTRERQGHIGELVKNYQSKGESPNLIQEIDALTKSNFSYTTYSTNILGTFFKAIDKEGNIIWKFWSDIWNFHLPIEYNVYKPKKELLGEILLRVSGIRTREDDTQDKEKEKYGVVRYTSTNFIGEESAPFYINTEDILARRTALFGMTRTGKSNSIKKLVDTVERINEQRKIKNEARIGQIIFDVNGEYASEENTQDDMTIYKKYTQRVSRYSFVERGSDFKLIKINFLDESTGSLQEGFELIKLLLTENNRAAEYFKNFLTLDWEIPEKEDYSAYTRYYRKLEMYKCILWKAGFKNIIKETSLKKLNFAKELNELVGIKDIEPMIDYDRLINVFDKIWELSKESAYFRLYFEQNWVDWLDEEMKSLLTMLTGRKNPGKGDATVNAYKKLIPLKQYHTHKSEELFTTEILSELKKGRIVIVDLSLGEDEIKKVYSEKLATTIFEHNKSKFISGEQPPYIQLYFEEAHNLFPSNGEEYTNIYNRLAKEGAKYRLGLVYATQEASAIHSSILKNTENWFISHLNNTSEIKTLNGYYDFWDYSESLQRFSNSTDKGYSRIKMLSYPFTIPVQIDKF